MPFDVAVIDRALPDRRGDDRRAARPRVHRRSPAPSSCSWSQQACAATPPPSRRSASTAICKKPVTASTLLDALQQLHGATAAGDLLTVHSVGEQRSRPLRLLIADDNPVNCRLAGIMLEKAGHAVQSRWRTAPMRWLPSLAEPFDAVLMDIQMPVMGGLEATRRISAIADPRRASVPIIAITANAMKGDDEDCYAAGMSGYVTKPIDRSVLLETLDRLTTAPAGGLESLSGGQSRPAFDVPPGFSRPAVFSCPESVRRGLGAGASPFRRPRSSPAADRPPARARRPARGRAGRSRS
jgi:two-component system, sensor histidine kinase and response regulator